MTLFDLIDAGTAAERWVARRGGRTLEVFWDAEASGAWPNGPGWSYRLSDSGGWVAGDLLDVTDFAYPVHACEAALREAGWRSPAAVDSAATDAWRASRAPLIVHHTAQPDDGLDDATEYAGSDAVCPDELW